MSAVLFNSAFLRHGARQSIGEDRRHHTTMSAPAPPSGAISHSPTWRLVGFRSGRQLSGTLTSRRYRSAKLESTTRMTRRRALKKPSTQRPGPRRALDGSFRVQLEHLLAPAIPLIRPAPLSELPPCPLKPDLAPSRLGALGSFHPGNQTLTLQKALCLLPRAFDDLSQSQTRRKTLRSPLGRAP